MSTVSTISTATNIQTDYIKLLIAQLQYQNPLEPLDNNEMASQLAQFSELQQLESMNTSFADILAISNRSYANSLLGKNVTFYVEDETTGALDKKVGSVDSVFNDHETGESLLGVTAGEGEEAQDYTLSMDSVILIEN